MTDILRYMRLGIINIMGITIPGLLVLTFVTLGFVLPLYFVITPLNEFFLGPPHTLFGLFWQNWFGMQGGGAIFTILLFILAYVTGYIIRLTSPDELDKISAALVLKKMKDDAAKGEGEKAEEDYWPYRGATDDKFPYHNFKDYLEHRNLPELAALVKWDGTKKGKRTKTHINIMKIEVASTDPDLSATIEANEAHVRLMFGTWMVGKICAPLIGIGIIAGLVGLIIQMICMTRNALFPNYPYAMFVFIGFLLRGGMNWAKGRIENLFHYQRVRELMYIVGCTYYARNRKKQCIE